MKPLLCRPFVKARATTYHLTARGPNQHLQLRDELDTWEHAAFEADPTTYLVDVAHNPAGSRKPYQVAIEIDIKRDASGCISTVLVTFPNATATWWEKRQKMLHAVRNQLNSVLKN